MSQKAILDIIIQVRCNSRRFYQKTIQPVGIHQSVIEAQISRIFQIAEVRKIIIVTSHLSSDQPIEDIYRRILPQYPHLSLYRGSLDDVLDRFYQASRLTRPQEDPNNLNNYHLVRLTGDCLLVDPIILRQEYNKYLTHNLDYLCFGTPKGFPDGFDFEIFRYELLEDAYLNSTSKYDREHVTQYFQRPFVERANQLGKKGFLETSNGRKGFLHTIETICQEYNIKLEDYPNINFRELEVSLDYYSDYQILDSLFKNLEYDFSYFDVLDYLNHNYPNLLASKRIAEIPRGHGTGELLYNDAKKYILGGTSLLSKRPELLLPGYWPTYYRQAKGIEIISLDGEKFLDFSYMSVGACILGYQDYDVDLAVHQSINRGIISTLNSPNEVELAKTMCQLHPWAGMAKFTRGAGEACAMAVRIGRAIAGQNRYRVAFCGYHGWHDWYLAANLKDQDSLNDHLLEGLSPKGVPLPLKESALPFKYNHPEELETLVSKYGQEIGVIIMEVQRSQPPTTHFLEQIKTISEKNKIVLIFDEVSSGFRTNCGGIHLTYGITPDLAVFGKALGNGYPIACVIGKREMMLNAQESFISSTFWTEDIGYSAALATIKKYQEKEVDKYLNTLGTYFQEKLKEIDGVCVSGFPAITSWSINAPSEWQLTIKTLLTQKLLERGILGSTALYLSYAHTRENIDYFLKHLKDVLVEIKELIGENNNQKRTLEEFQKTYLWGHPATPKFGRLT